MKKMIAPRPALVLALAPLLAPVLILAACIPLPVESDISACPATDLVSVSFTAGKPPGGAEIAPAPGEKGALTWDLSGAKGDVFLTCHYTGGTERLQRLPGEMRACTLTAEKNLSCKSYI